MSLSRGNVIALIVIAALSALGAWIYQSIEFYDREIETGFQGEAKLNPFFVSGRLMQHFGATVRHYPVYTQLPSPGTTLIFPTERRTLSKLRSEELLNWVKSGGHLMAVTWTLWQDNEEREVDFLLDPLNVRQFENRPAPSDTKNEPRQRNAPASPASIVNMPHDEGTLQVRFDKQFRLEDANTRADWKIADEAGAHVLRYRLGKGLITVLSDHRFMENRQIGKWDHAALLYRLAEPRPGREICFIYSDDIPALWRWLIEHAWTVLISASLLLITWLWLATRRLGPLIPPPARERRSMVGHVVASGYFLWQRKSSAVLHQAVVDAFLRQIRLRHPQWATLKKDELARETATITGLSVETVTSALQTDFSRNEEQFTHAIYIIELLKTKI